MELREANSVETSANMPLSELSVVVCTRNRLKNLKRCVDALLSVTTTRAWEIVIVDNGSNDGTSEYLASLTDADRPLIRPAFEAKRGLAAARNKGWHTAAASIIAFTDDDCYVSHDYVDSIVATFQENPEIGFLTGRILLYDNTDYKITIQESQDRLYFKPRAFIHAGQVQGANFAFRRTALEGIGGFDERMGAGTPFPCEDIDAVAAALWSGIPGIYDPRPLVYHHHGRKTEREVQQLMRSYDAARGAYYAKYIMKKASRRQYCRAWIETIRREFIGTIRARRFPRMRHSLREFSSGLNYLVSDLFSRVH